MNFVKSSCFFMTLIWPHANCLQSKEEKTVISYEVEDTQYTLEKAENFDSYEYDEYSYNYEEIVPYAEDYYKNEETLGANNNFENHLNRKNNSTDHDTNDIRIVGGLLTDQHEFPWMAALVYENANYKSLIFCGGSIISYNVIMTAAHCLRLMDHKGKIFCIIHEIEDFFDKYC